MINGAVLEEEAVLPLNDARAIARFFQVLADPTRVRMIKALANGVSLI
jgi:DNA-binding transcriptional ArsR family regulator